ncbi:MAG: sulfur-carrier protein adenylyltransferase/sulfurtransferase [Blastocatellia bacterium]|jgi:adenylyltransferase/sulfurtransferase|nr:sulfur-carrier protein adenylyltransferase/sulfurtransferase [Blastocatellia bacterium]
MEAERYDRQQRIAGWKQPALSAARVIVAGAGALGNEAIKNFALMGVGHLLIIDFDRIELSNLSRAALFLETDVGRRKAEVAAERAAQLNSEIQVRHIDGDLFSDIGLGFYRHADLVVGALDNVAARSQVGLSCSLAGIPFLDGGMWAWGGEARWFKGGAETCFECTLSDDDRSFAFERRSCTGFRQAEDEGAARVVPTTISIAALIGGLLAQEAARYLCGWEIQGGEALVYNGLKLSLHRSALARDSQCPYHEPYAGVKELQARAASATALDLLRIFEPEAAGSLSLELGRDFLLSFRCSSCGAQEEVNALVNRLGASSSRCPRCGHARQPEIMSSVTSGDALAGRSLSELGVPPGEVLAVRAGDELRLCELTGDVVALWQ